MSEKTLYGVVQPLEVQGDGGNGNITRKEVYTRVQYQELTKALINKIKDDGYTSIVAVARGGLSILAMIQEYGKTELPSNIRLGVLHASSYVGVGAQKEIFIADAISFIDGGGIGDKPLYLDDMLDSARSKQAIDRWDSKQRNSASKPDWAVLLQKQHSSEDATHVGQYVGNDWVVQPHENYGNVTGDNIAKIATSPSVLMGPEGDFDNYQRIAEMLSVYIYRKGINPTAIIGSGDIYTAHTASMVSRILNLPSGTQLDGGELSFVNPKPGGEKDLGSNPVSIRISTNITPTSISISLRTGVGVEQIVSRYKV